MAGILNLPQRRAVVPRLCLPSGSRWDVWSFPAPAEAPEGPVAADGGSELPVGSQLGLPARHVVAVPLWLQTGDPALFRELIRAQLERRGMTGLAESHWAHAVVVREENRTLVTAFLINGSLPAELLVPQVRGYEIAARCRSLPADTYAVWAEEGGLAVGGTRGTELAYLQFFPGRSALPEIAGELECLRRWLSWERVMEERAPIVFLPSITSLAPKLPEPPLALIPAAIDHARKQARQAQRQRRLLRNLALAYGAVVLAVASGLGVLKWQERQLEKQASASAPAVAGLSETAARWRALRPAIDPSRYPIECLLACVAALPPEVRLTEFDHNPDDVLIKGEGRDAASIFKFLDAVKADPELKQWKWTLPQPQLLPNNRAQFQLEGTHGEAKAH